MLQLRKYENTKRRTAKSRKHKQRNWNRDRNNKKHAL